MENPDEHAGAGLGGDPSGLPPPPPPPLDAALGSDPAEVLPPPPPHLPGGGPYEVAQGADGSAYPAEHASLNGTSGEAAGYHQAAGATENGAAADEMPEPMVPEQSYEDAVDSQPGLFPDSERRALEPPASPARLLEQSPVMSSEDKRVLEAIRSAVNAAGKNYGCIRDAADPTMVSLVLKKMPHIDACWLSGRIREFQAIVNDHVQKKVPITENKEILLEVFASASSKKRAFDGEAGNCHAKRSSGSDSADNRSAGWMEKKANAEVWLQEAEAAKTIVSSPLNIGDVNRKLQDLGFRGKDLINALEVFMDPSNLQNLEIRQVFLTMKEEDDARNYVLHKLGEN